MAFIMAKGFIIKVLSLISLTVLIVIFCNFIGNVCSNESLCSNELCLFSFDFGKNTTKIEVEFFKLKKELLVLGIFGFDESFYCSF